MVKRADVLDRVEREASGPYEAQPIAKRAPAARKRATTLVLLLTASLLALALLGTPEFALLSAIALLAALLLMRQKLAGLVAAAFCALLSIGVPLSLLRLMDATPLQLVAGGATVALGLAMLPSLVTLARDAELQYAYGVWARR